MVNNFTQYQQTEQSPESSQFIQHKIWKDNNIQYSQRYSMINQCDTRVTHLSDTDTVQSET